MKQPATSYANPRQWRHEDDWRREQYDALLRCDESDDECGVLDAYRKARNVLVDIDNNGARRIVSDGRVVIDEITNPKAYSEWFANTSLATSETLKNVARLLKRHRNDVTHEPEPSEVLVTPDLCLQGDRLDRWLRELVSKDSYERIFSQMILDLREEYGEAEANGGRLKTQFVVVRAYLSVARALFMQVRLVGAVIRALRGS